MNNYDNFEIGWTVHNANVSLNNKSHMIPGYPYTGNDILISNPLIGSTIKGITTIPGDANFFANQTFHVPYTNNMMDVTPIVILHVLQIYYIVSCTLFIILHIT